MSRIEEEFPLGIHWIFCKFGQNFFHNFPHDNFFYIQAQKLLSRQILMFPLTFDR